MGRMSFETLMEGLEVKGGFSYRVYTKWEYFEKVFNCQNPQRFCGYGNVSK